MNSIKPILLQCSKCGHEEAVFVSRGSIGALLARLNPRQPCPKCGERMERNTNKTIRF